MKKRNVQIKNTFIKSALFLLTAGMCQSVLVKNACALSRVEQAFGGGGFEADSREVGSVDINDDEGSTERQETLLALDGNAEPSQLKQELSKSSERKGGKSSLARISPVRSRLIRDCKNEIMEQVQSDIEKSSQLQLERITIGKPTALDNEVLEYPVDVIFTQQIVGSKEKQIKMEYIVAVEKSCSTWPMYPKTESKARTKPTARGSSGAKHKAVSRE